MLKEGLIEETEKILKKYPDFAKKVKALGNKEVVKYLEGQMGKKEDLGKLITLHTRQFAKRQMTWLKKEKDVKWIAASKQAFTLVSDFLE